MIRRILPLVLLIFFSGRIFSQSTTFVESGFSLANGKQMPFWLRANQNGIYPLNANSYMVYAGANFEKYNGDSAKVRKSFKAVGEIIGRTTLSNQSIVIPQAYIAAKVGVFELMTGRRRENFGLCDSTGLSSGSFVFSGNALPMYKLQVGIPEYVNIAGKGVVAIKGAFTHGWFDNKGYAKDVFLHQKYIFGRIFKTTSKVQLFGGFTHQVQWGGYPSENLSDFYVINGKFPSSLLAYKYVVTGKSLNLLTPEQQSKFPLNDAGNRVGNHLGTVDLATFLNFKKISLLFYRQSYYEDGGLFYLNNIADGLNGVSIQVKNSQKKFYFKSIVLEFLNTKSQGGTGGSDNTDPFLRGGDNYFNHGQFRDGWSYNGNTIGTPFITPSIATKETLPKLSDIFFNNTRVNVYHAAFNTIVNQKTSVIIKFSKSYNFGIYGLPFPANTNQTSVMLQVLHPFETKQYGKFQLKAMVGLDNGKLYDNTTGFYLGVRKVWE